MAQVNLVLYDKDGLEYQFEDSNPNVSSSTYKKGVVKEEKGTWILYREINNNGSIDGGSASDIIIIKTSDGLISLPFSPKSILRTKDEVNTATVFEHGHYGGNNKTYEEAGCADVTNDFPTGQKPGASSIIIWPNKSWELYKEKNFEGGEKIVQAGWHPTPAAMGFPNDSLKSLKPR